jgi:hypothetical protein
MVFAPFQGEQLIDHILYIGSDPLLRMLRPGQLRLTFRLPSAMQATQLRPLLDAIQWEAFRAGRWEPLPSPSSDLPDEFHDFTLTFPDFAGADVLALSGPGLAASPLSRWIRGRLSKPITQLPMAQEPMAKALWIDSLIPRIDKPADTGIPPDHVHVNAAPVDFTRGFFPLGENPKVDDTVFIANAEALEKVELSLRPEELGRVRLLIDVDVGDATLQWEYFGEAQGQRAWLPLRERVGVFDDTHTLTRDGKIRLDLSTPPFPLTFPRADADNVQAFFFRVSIEDGTYRKVPCLRALQVFLRTPDSSERLVAPVVAYTSEAPQVVVQGAANRVDLTGLTPVDLQNPFYPFGLNPGIGNTFYFGLPLPSPGQINPGPAEPVQLLPQTARLVWEFLSQSGWKRLGASSTREATLPPTEYAFRDETLAFTSSGTVSFQRPPDLAPGQVNGQADYWIRARLVSGLYGRAAEFILVDPANPARGFMLRPGTGALNAPVISAIRLGYETQDPSPLVITHNHFRLQDETDKNSTPGEVYRPFEPIDDAAPTFYLAFDQKLPNDAVNLYFVVPPRQFVEKLR